MEKFYLVRRKTLTLRDCPGFIVVAYYQEDPKNWLELPRKLAFFNEQPPLTLEGDIVNVPLDGTYVHPLEGEIDKIEVMCPKTKEGLYIRGYSPHEQAGWYKTHLERVTK